MLNDETYTLLSQTCFDKFKTLKIISYSLEEDLLINFKYNKLEKQISLKLDDINIKILKDNKLINQEELDDILKERFDKIKQLSGECALDNYFLNLFKDSIKLKKKDNLIEVNIQPTNDIEIVILCSRITLFDNTLETKIGEIKY